MSKTGREKMSIQFKGKISHKGKDIIINIPRALHTMVKEYEGQQLVITLVDSRNWIYSPGGTKIKK